MLEIGCLLNEFTYEEKDMLNKELKNYISQIWCNEYEYKIMNSSECSKAISFSNFYLYLNYDFDYVNNNSIVDINKSHIKLLYSLLSDFNDYDCLKMGCNILSFKDTKNFNNIDFELFTTEFIDFIANDIFTLDGYKFMHNVLPFMCKVYKGNYENNILHKSKNSDIKKIISDYLAFAIFYNGNKEYNLCFRSYEIIKNVLQLFDINMDLNEQRYIISVLANIISIIHTNKFYIDHPYIFSLSSRLMHANMGVLEQHGYS